MQNADLESEVHGSVHFNNTAASGQAAERAMEESRPLALLCGENGTRKEAIYKAVIALSRSIAGRTDLRSLVSGLAESLRRIFRFDHAGLVLHDPAGDAMQGYIWNEPGNSVLPRLRLPVDQDPAGWVLLNQRPLVVSRIQSESRWPEAIRVARELGINTLILVPLTSGDHRLGALGVSFVAPRDVTPDEIEFLERAASEFAVAVQAFLARQEAIQERDRLHTLCEITRALVSKLEQDELFCAISHQLAKIVRHDSALLTLLNEDAGTQDVYALPSTDSPLVDELKDCFGPEGMPVAEVLATRRPFVVGDIDTARYRSPAFQRFVDLGFKSAYCVPLTTRNRTIGVMSLLRMTDESWSVDDRDFLAQVGTQIAVALENSFTYRQVAEMKDRLTTEKLYLEDEIRVERNIGNMVGEAPAFQSVLKSIQTVARTGATVLITGETGTGKELVARAIHELSGSKGSLVVVNCAAIPASLLESELFGHEKGSFTGAVAQKIGRFELAHNGTLFLDEIGEMPLELQPKLLRAIQDQQFERVGGSRTIQTNVRFVAATNRDLKTMVEENKFRADLYYRLHVFPLKVPPLRERREDIPLLTRYFVQIHSKRMGRKIETIPTPVLDALTSHDWPGNIRELQNVIERSVILSSGPELRVPIWELSCNLSPNTPHVPASDSSGVTSTERARILEALRQARGVVGGPEGAAARLGLKRTTLQSRMRKYNIGRLYQ